MEEVSSGVRPIRAAGTSIAAFIGEAQRCSLTEAVKIFSFVEFQNLYGDFLNSSYLAHSVYQFFNNGGTQCYIVRVAGPNIKTANILINDQAAKANTKPSLTVSAVSPGIWGDNLILAFSDGTQDPANEFNLAVYSEEKAPQSPTLLEKFENLNMIPSAANFVEKATSGSKYIRVAVDIGNTNVQASTSRGKAAPSLPLSPGRTKFKINLNSDDYQEINLQEAVDEEQVDDLTSPENVAAALQYRERKLNKLRGSTDAKTFTQFTCKVDAGVLLLTSGVAAGLSSSVAVAPASNSSEDASGLLNLVLCQA